MISAPAKAHLRKKQVTAPHVSQERESDARQPNQKDEVEE
jgi:hypothetical protein